MKNDHLDAVTAELAAVGIQYEVSYGGKHIHVNWQHDGHARAFVVPASPSDRRGWLNSRSDVRKILKQDGLILGDLAELPRTFLRDKAVLVSSHDVARHFDKAHKDVLRAIDRVCEDIGDRTFTERNFAPSTYTDPTGRSLRCFDLTRDAFTLLAMGFTGSEAARWKVSYLAAFNAMEAEITRMAIEASAAEVVAGRLTRIEGDLGALIELNLETKPRHRKTPFVRPSVQRRMRRLVMGAA